MSATYRARLCLYNEEVFQGLGAVNRCCQVGKVVTEFHRLVVHSVYPTSQHRHLGCGAGAFGVACIAEVLERNCYIGLGGIQVLRNTGTEQQLTAVAVVHKQLDGAQGTVVLTYDVCTGRPRQYILANGIAILVGTVDESVVFPSVAPRVGDDPRSHLVFFYFSDNSVAVEVKLNAVVISADSHSVVEGITPRLDIFLAVDAGLLVGCGCGYCSPGTIGGYSDTGYTTAVHRCVTAVVVEPLFQLLTAFGSVGGGKADAACRFVPHSAVPLVVTLHPSIVGVVVGLRTEEPAVGASAICGYIGDTYRLCHSVGGTCLVGKQPGEMRGVLVLGQRSVEVAVTAHLVSERITDTLCRTARTAILVKDGGEVLGVSVVYKRGQLGLALFGACLAACHILGRLRLGGFLVFEIGEDAAIYLNNLAVRQGVVFYLCSSIECRHKTYCQKQESFHFILAF